MSNFVPRGALSITCTCTHGGGGHAPPCPFFTATSEQYVAVCRERDEARDIVKIALAVLDGEPGADDRLADAIERLNVVDGAGHTGRPWWLRVVTSPSPPLRPTGDETTEKEKE